MTSETSWPTTTDLLHAFATEIAAAGGTVTDTLDDGARLFVRSTLPGLREVAPGDRLQGGVALRATAEDVRVHPYVFRLVCKNGAIAARSTQSWRVERDDPSASADRSACDILVESREAVRACCADEAFTAVAAGMRSAMQQEMDAVLGLIPMLRFLPHGQAQAVLRQVLGRFEADGDRSRYGLMNAVTATARDTHDPELRWRLEEFGGGIPALLAPPVPCRPHGATRRVPAEMAGVLV